MTGKELKAALGNLDIAGRHTNGIGTEFSYAGFGYTPQIAAAAQTPGTKPEGFNIG